MLLGLRRPAGADLVGFHRAPAGFIPVQDKGYLLVNVQLPDAASRGADRSGSCSASKKSPCRTRRRRAHGGHRRAIDPAGGQRAEFRRHVRDAQGLSRAAPLAASPADAIAARLQTEFQKEIADGLVNIFGAPPVDGLGTAGGFKIIVEDRGDNNTARPAAGRRDNRRARAIASADLQGLFCSFRADTPWLKLDIDRDSGAR